MKITQKDLIGDIKYFPIEVVEKMIERQVEQGNPADVKVFQKSKAECDESHGFYWHNTSEGWDFWNEVIKHKDFDLFFEKYPKNEEEEDYWIDPKGRRMLIWGGDEYECYAEERIVIAKLPSKSAEPFVAVGIDCEKEFEKGEEYDITCWANAKPIPQKTKLSLSSIAEKFGLKPDEIEIDFDK